MFSKLAKKHILSIAVLVLSASAMLAPGLVKAQQSSDSHFRVTPYLWMLSLDGTTAVAGDDADVDASFSDILDNLNMALSVNLEWQTRSNWFFIFDPMYADLELDLSVPSPPAPLPITGKVEVELVIADGLVGYNLHENFDIYAGARYYDQDITIVPSGMAPSIPLGDDWTDFILGFRVQSAINDNWSVSGKLDGAVGGDSDSALNLFVVFSRHFGENKHLDIGYRHYDVDYESGSGLERFKWDVAHSGPVVGFSWRL